MLETGERELLDVVLGDPRDRLLAEIRAQVNPQIALVSGGRGNLAAPGRKLPDQTLAGLGDGHALGHGRKRRLAHQFAQASFGHGPGQAIARARRTDWPELAGHLPVADPPLAVPRVSLLEDAAGAVASLGWPPRLVLGCFAGRHSAFIRRLFGLRPRARGERRPDPRCMEKGPRRPGHSSSDHPRWSRPGRAPRPFPLMHDDHDLGSSSRRGPAPEHRRDYARRRPLARLETAQRLSPSPSCMRARPVVRRRQPAVPIAPLPHRLQHPLPSPAPLDRAGMAGLAVRVGVALAVARLGVRAAAAAHPDVACLDRPRLLPGRV